MNTMEKQTSLPINIIKIIKYLWKNLPLMYKPGSWLLLAKRLKNTLEE